MTAACKGCLQYNSASSWCSALQTKKTGADYCKGWCARLVKEQPKTNAEQRRLDALVTWMRSRGVAALKAGTTAITLASMLEPNVESIEPKERLSTDELRAIRRQQNSEFYYNGGLPATKGD